MKHLGKALAILAVTLSLFLAACGAHEDVAQEPTQPPQAEQTELVVFAAASMTETLTQIEQLYAAEAPDVKLVFSFDSSGTLQTQIEQGATCDLFLSAAQKQMNALEEKDYLLEDTRVDLLENQVVLVVPEGNPAGVAAFEDLTKDDVRLIALGGADVPVGQYSQELLTNMGIWDALQEKITFGSNVKEVTTWVSEGAVDCGVVYGTDANAAGLQAVATAPEELLDNRVVYPAAVLAASAHVDEARAFLDFLQSDECQAVFEQAGFAVIG